jgi:hypothetical protein
MKAFELIKKEKKKTDVQKVIKKPTLVMQNGFVQAYSSNGLLWPRSSGLCCFCSSLLPFLCDHISSLRCFPSAAGVLVPGQVFWGVSNGSP